MATSRLPDGFVRFVTLLRWTTALVGVGWAALTAADGLAQIIAAGLLLSYALVRSWYPLNYRGTGARALVAIVIELAVALAAVIITGGWTSPFIFALFTPVAAAGLAQGQFHALRVGVTAVAALALSSAILGHHTESRELITWTGELFLIAVVASYGRTLLTRAEAAVQMGATQAEQLARANALLADLDHVARDLSVSFDFQETIRGAVINVRSQVNADVCVLLLTVENTTQWNVAMSEGVGLAGSIATNALPAAAREAVRSGNSNPLAVSLEEAPGFDPDCDYALYVPLRVGERLIGILAVERTTHRYSEADRATVARIGQAIALSVDNARWFERLQVRGAARERTRLARDLHDRLGQGIAYVAFELDRLCAASDDPDRSELASLRDDARGMVSELRETLSDLRTDVTEEFGLIDAIEQFLARVQLRSGLETHCVVNSRERIGLGREREVWRIAQEAITNVERHADATMLTVRWTVDGATACLEIQDDGVGYTGDPEPSAVSLGRPSYGITGMRERAALLGAALDIEILQPAGTRVRVELSTAAYDSALLTVDGNRGARDE